MRFLITTTLILLLSNMTFAQNFNGTSNELVFASSYHSIANYTPKKQQIRFEVGRFETVGTSEIFIPKSFSPDADGVNDVFKIHSRNILDFEMLVFNQWGEFVFKTNDIDIEWDGTLNNQPIRKGAYVYVIKLKTLNGANQKYSGCLMIEE